MTNRRAGRRNPSTLPRKVLWCALITTLWFAVGVRAIAQPERPEQTEAERAAMQDMLSAREFTFAIHEHAGRHKTLPADLASLLGAVQSRTGKSVEDLLKSTFTSALDESPRRLPEDTPAWINQNASFKYLGREGVAIDDLSDWDELAVAHLRLGKGHVFNHPEFGPLEVFSVAFFDGHVEMLTRDEAEFVIEESRQVYEAVATGGELPEKRQIATDLTDVVGAIRAYAEANNGLLPPDLGAILPYVRHDDKRLSTARGRARIFLTPRKAADTFIPDDPTPEWINRNTSYVYLGGADLRLARIEDPRRTILVHGRENETFEGRKMRRMTTLMPVGRAAGHGDSEPEEYARWLIDQSRQVIEFARSGAPLPEFQHIMRDMRLLHRALMEYALANDDNLPPDFAALYDYVDDPERLLTDAERAAVFLSPTAEKSVHIPESPTPEWVQRSTDYVYEGDSGVTMGRARRTSVPYAIIHTDPESPIWLRNETDGLNLMPAVFPTGPQITIADVAEETIANAKAAREQARAK